MKILVLLTVMVAQLGFACHDTDHMRNLLLSSLKGISSGDCVDPDNTFADRKYFVTIPESEGEPDWALLERLVLESYVELPRAEMLVFQGSGDAAYQRVLDTVEARQSNVFARLEPFEEGRRVWMGARGPIVFFIDARKTQLYLGIEGWRVEFTEISAF